MNEEYQGTIVLQWLARLCRHLGTALKTSDGHFQAVFDIESWIPSHDCFQRDAVDSDVGYGALEVSLRTVPDEQRAGIGQVEGCPCRGAANG
jgi:hypothetical protein